MTEEGLPNYLGDRLQLPSNMHFSKWEALACTEEDTTLINFLKYGFTIGYEGPMLTPTDHNHTSTMHPPRDVAAYVLGELEEGAMLGLFEVDLFVPWCQVNTLPTFPEKDSHVRRVIMDISWPHLPGVSVNACTPKDRYMDAAQR